MCSQFGAAERGNRKERRGVKIAVLDQCYQSSLVAFITSYFLRTPEGVLIVLARRLTARLE